MLTLRSEEVFSKAENEIQMSSANKSILPVKKCQRMALWKGRVTPQTLKLLPLLAYLYLIMSADFYY